jgi:hypothetical protein
MPNDSPADTALSQPQPRRRWLRFRLKSLLLVIALVAFYLGGRASMKVGRNEPPTGTWQMNMLSGRQRPVTLTAFPGKLFRLNAGGVLAGNYLWKSGQLQMVTPDDKRYMGLAWQWAGDELVLVAEPPGYPSGATYLGTRLRFVSLDTSTIAQKTVPVVPSIISFQQQRARGGVARLEDYQPTFRPMPWLDPPPGEWHLTMPAGAQSSINLNQLLDGSFELVGGVFDGVYQVRNGQLEVAKPSDMRMLGLAWARQGDELVLVSEPSPPPTGSSYLGARLRPTTIRAGPVTPQSPE